MVDDLWHLRIFQVLAPEACKIRCVGVVDKVGKLAKLGPVSSDLPLYAAQRFSRI